MQERWHKAPVLKEWLHDRTAAELSFQDGNPDRFVKPSGACYELTAQACA